MLLPIRSKNPPESLPIVTIILMVINLAVYIFTTNGLEIRESVLDNWGLKSGDFNFVDMNTSMFLHGGLFHFLGNMWFLYLFGFAVEGRLKSLKFVILYFLAGYAGDGLHHVLIGHAHPDIPSIGASGAIMGVVGAALWMFPHGKIDIFYYWGIWAVGVWECPMWGIACIYLGMDLLGALISTGGGGVGHLAHLGGAAGGLLICMLYRPKRDDDFTSTAKATLAESKDLSILSRLQLANLHQANPEDDAVILNWMYKSLREPGGPKPECTAAFFKFLPRMLQQQEIGPIAHCINALNLPPGTVKSSIIMDCATRLERSNDNMSAIRMYEAILKDPNATQGDQEAAMFRGGLLSEAVFQRFDSAQAAYKELIRRWPMSPFADQAKTRLAYVESKLSPSPNP